MRTLCHTTQHGAVLIIFPLNLQTVTITRMLSSGEEGSDIQEWVCQNPVQDIDKLRQRLIDRQMIKQIDGGDLG